MRSLTNLPLLIAGPQLWYNLSLHICDSELAVLAYHLLPKTHQFCWGPCHYITLH